MRVPVPLAAVAGGVVGRALRASWRYRGPSAELVPAVYALWHEHLLPLCLFHAGQGAAVLVSRHRDGEILARVLDSLGYEAVRGSSTRGGAAGLRRMIEAGREGRPLAFTPDGPRGPARVPKPGVVRAASAAGLPVVPVGAASTRGWRLGSWDRFLVPAPAATVFVSQGPTLRVPPDLPPAAEREWAERVGAAIDRQVALCEAAAGVGDGAG